jgi:hypothetical protein
VCPTDESVNCEKQLTLNTLFIIVITAEIPSRCALTHWVIIFACRSHGLIVLISDSVACVHNYTAALNHRRDEREPNVRELISAYAAEGFFFYTQHHKKQRGSFNIL